MNSQRISNWPRALDDYIEACRTIPFEWGRHDCLLFSAGAIQAITDCDPAIDYRVTYSTEEEAKQIIKDAGGWVRLVSSHMKAIGAKRINSPMAQRGDIVFYEVPGQGLAAGVCLGDIAAFASTDGLVFPKVKDCRKQAWRID